MVPGDNPPAMRLPPHYPLFLFLFLPGAARAAEPFFQKGDVIALVGGEDMVVASEYGYLELLLVRALPGHRLRFRNLAWEGDPVFEQRRDLGFPTWEEQLDKIGATVVLAQFGQMESLMGTGSAGAPPAVPGAPPGTSPASTPPRNPPPPGGAPAAAGGAPALPEFIAAYEKLIERFSGGGKGASSSSLLSFSSTTKRSGRRKPAPPRCASWQTPGGQNSSISSRGSSTNPTGQGCATESISMRTATQSPDELPQSRNFHSVVRRAFSLSSVRSPAPCKIRPRFVASFKLPPGSLSSCQRLRGVSSRAALR